MARPTEDIPDDWAADATWTGGDRVGDNTKTKPSAGQILQGFVAGLAFFGDFANWLLKLIADWLRYTDERNFGAIFGDGSDGSAVVSGTTTLTKDMYYTTLTVQNGGIVETDGYRIFCRTSCIVQSGGKIRHNGANGTNGGAGGGGGGLGAQSATIGNGSDGGSGTQSVGSNGQAIGDSLGAVGGGGGNGSGGLGGNAGTWTALSASYGSLRHGPSAIHAHAIGSGVIKMVRGGSGGGGGGGDGSNYGGGGGGGGGAVTICARLLSIDGAVEASAGAGGDATAGNCGGGGGGGGGFMVLVYRNIGGSGQKLVWGGNGGAGAGTGTSGTSGTNGTLIEIEV